MAVVVSWDETLCNSVVGAVVSSSGFLVDKSVRRADVVTGRFGFVDISA